MDIALLRNDPDLVRRSVSSRGSDVDVDSLIAIDAELRQNIAKLDQLRAQQKTQPKDGDIAIEAARSNTDELRKLTQDVRTLQDRRDDLWARLPNLLAVDTPSSEDDQSNVELRRVGNPGARRRGPRTRRRR